MSSIDLAARRAFGPRTRLTVALCAAGLGMGQSAWAQSADSAAPKVMDTVVVTASGYEQQIQDAPASISVITRQDLEKKFYRDVTDAVSYTHLTLPTNREV